MVKNDSLITYEKAFSGQAAVKKFFIATFLERKKMSTKTSFKRIALVAATALAIGGFTAVSPATAANTGTATMAVTGADGSTTGTNTVTKTAVTGTYVAAAITVTDIDDNVNTITSTGVGTIQTVVDGTTATGLASTCDVAVPGIAGATPTSY
jgi:hypothetical protein